MTNSSTIVRAGRGAERVWHALRDMLWPPHCIGCDSPVEERPGLCPTCWQGLTFLTAPECARCGIPFPYTVADGALCGACAARAPAYQRARAAVLYDAASRPLILGFKYADRLDGAGMLSRWLERAARTLLVDAEVIVPVPLHWARLAKRRYNQSAVLAGRLAKASGVPFAPELLARLRATPSLGALGATQRRKAVKGAFVVPESARIRLAGKRCLLVDDVLTSGATAEECATTLLRAGAGAVDVVALARTPLGTI